ncbi:hypothetical protein ACQ4LE_008783 [Meloidogyne hapla]|uniref:NTF2 domain-containing protein n=1 Tax=Meloidogyne hapla TaxID=6305 RepID=A0A1I8BYW5_MELHA
MVEKVNDVVTQVVSAKSSDNNNNVSEAIAANSPSNKNSPNKSDLLKVLAFQFFEAYYTKLSDHPDDIGTFYGDDSSFVLGDVEETGRENIQRAIEKMNFGACKSRFYSVKAAPEMGDNCKVFQVCGELTLKGQPAPRRFCQTIVLSCVPPNVLYVKSNIFQWLDIAFPMNSSEKVYFISAPTTIPAPAAITPVVNGTCNNNKTMEKDVVTTNVEPILNGGVTLTNGGSSHQSPQPPANFVTLPMTTDAIIAPPPGLEKSNEVLPLQTSKSPLPVNGTPTPYENEVVEVDSERFTVPTSDSTNKITDPSPPLNNIISDDQKPKRHSPMKQQQHPNVKLEPKSWNKVVSGGQNKMPNIQPNMTTTTTVPIKTSIAVKKTMQSEDVGSNAQKQRQSPPQKQPQQPFNAENNTGWTKNDAAGQQQQQKRSSSLGDDNNGKNNNQKQQQQQMSQSTNNKSNFVAPRKDWPHRIYFNNIVKPGRFVDFKTGQKELMKQLMTITPGVEFVGIKPVSLRKEYKTAFGFIDFTTGKDVQTVYDAAKKTGEKKGGDKGGGPQLRVSIPTFEFDGYISLTSDKTNNLAHGNNNGNNNNNNFR